MGFDPVASARDLSTRWNPAHLVYALEQRAGVEAGTLAPDIQAELDKLFEADLLVLTFPIWWFSVPAILKGWFDRVLVSGRCYGGRRIYDRGGLAGRRAVALFSLGSRDHMFGSEAIHGDLHAMIRPILQGTLAYVGYSVLPPFAAWHVPYLDRGARAAILDRLADHLNALDAMTPLAFPRLADYDDMMRPLARPS
jgi:NAD(P)H dehydrogenase (quinone)